MEAVLNTISKYISTDNNLIENMTEKNLINLFLLKRLEDEGKEIKLVYRNKKLVGGSVVEPLSKILDKGVIDQNMYYSGVCYCRDYELSNMSNHSRTSYDGSSISSAAPREKTISQSRLNAANNIDKIREIIKTRDLSQVTKHKNSETRPIIDNKKYIVLLDIIFEKQKSFYYTQQKTGMCYELIEKKVIDMLKIMNNYYNRTSKI